METNKENIRSRNSFKSRIPVPVEKLIRLPNQMVQAPNYARPPLKTIDNSNITEKHGEPSLLTQKSKNQKKITFKSCAKKVGICSKIKKDWVQIVYKDNAVGSSSKSVKSECKVSEVGVIISDKKESENKPLTVVDAISISVNSEVEEQIIENGGPLENKHDVAFIFDNDNDNDNENQETIWRFELERNTTLQVTKFDTSEVTPAALIEHKSIKNVKKTLKRPHSRELQGLSPVKSTNEHEMKAKRRLFERLEQKVLTLHDVWAELYTKNLAKDYADDIFHYLLSDENKPLGVPDQPNAIRACFINWLMKMNGPNGNPAVIQAACWYLDSYLSKAVVPLVQIQLVAAACYWMAQKQHGPIHSAPKIVRYGNHVFTTGDLQEMEKKVLSELRFPRQPIVPQEFITYISWCCEDREKEIEMAATFLCLAGQMVDKSLIEEYPSVIAATSIRCAAVLLKKIHFLDRLAKCPLFQKIMLKSKQPQNLSSTIYNAVFTISKPSYEYNILLEYYDIKPHRIYQKINVALKDMFDSSSFQECIS